MRQNFLRLATKDKSLQTPPAVRRHDDQIAMRLACLIDDRLVRPVAVDHYNIAPDAGFCRSVFGGLQNFRSLLFSVLVVALFDLSNARAAEAFARELGVIRSQDMSRGH